MTTPLVVGDHIYGIGSHGQVRGLLAETGEQVWESVAQAVRPARARL
jgi:glucose dehydrogenase